MKIVDTYSHLNGEEYLLIHHPMIYDEIKSIVTRVDASKLMTKVSKEKTMKGRKLYSPKSLNKEFARLFKSGRWESIVYRYCVTTNRAYLDQIVNLPIKQQKEFLQSHGVEDVIKSYKQTDFVKEAIAIEVQFGKYAFVAYDLFVKHLLFYSGGVINLGIEILPMKEMTQSADGGRLMSTGIAYYEGEVYNVMRHGRGNPPVPLLILGVAP
ncbi:MAG: hypothetical protein JXM79_24095 [Sedimentisphaerales bacterium]|nr:hypothetical protein [Sedimentisphaerales bacterium]